MDSLWHRCLSSLEEELPAQEFTTWIRPLQAVRRNGALEIFAPNEFVRERVTEHYLSRIQSMLGQLAAGESLTVRLEVGSSQGSVETSAGLRAGAATQGQGYPDNLNPDFTFESFVIGSSNQLAMAAGRQVAAEPGLAFNPLLIYGGSGLGKTHLMHAIGNRLKQERADARVVYLSSERFVTDMIKALQHNTINQFKEFYRSVETLLIDDIQFLAGKERSQDEFFHTFNALMENRQQIVLSCDRYPKEVQGLEDRLKSRFGWGLTTAIEPPDLETRVAILMAKGAQAGVELSEEVAFFIAKRVRSNVRDLEGALRKVVANARFMGVAIDVKFATEALRDLLSVQEKLISIENIQKTVAEYYKIRVADLLSKRRSRSVARPRQMAMAIAKELTDRSLPEIGDAFGGRDHTTVLHAHRKIKELRDSDPKTAEDFDNLLRTLSG